MLVGEGKKVEFLARCDMHGRRDGIQVVGNDKFLYVGHLWSGGVDIIDVSDPKNPKVAAFIPAPNDNTWNINVQVADDLLLIADEYKAIGGDRNQPWTAGLRIFDVSNPRQPHELSFTPSAGSGPHRMWYAGGRYAHVPFQPEGYTWPIYVIFDVSDPRRPQEVSRWWLPGMWQAGGEKPEDALSQPYSLNCFRNQKPAMVDPLTFKGEWDWFHGAVIEGDRAYCGWWDAGMIILNISDIAVPKLVSQLDFSPPFAGATHTCLPLPNRNLVVVAEEPLCDNCAEPQKMIWMVDVREEKDPLPVAIFPTPEVDYGEPGTRIGPHNLHEKRPGSFQSDRIIFNAHFNAGLRIYDTANPYRPEEIGYYLPPDPEVMMDPRPGKARRPSSQDVYVDVNGVVYLTDYNCGLYILEYTG